MENLRAIEQRYYDGMVGATQQRYRSREKPFLGAGCAFSRPFSRRVGLARWKCPQGSMVIVLFHLFYDFLLLVGVPQETSWPPFLCRIPVLLVLVLFVPTLSAVLYSSVPPFPFHPSPSLYK
jgi:hypothetical protein